MEELLVAVPTAAVAAGAVGVYLGRLSRRKQILPKLPPDDPEHEWTTVTARGWHCSHCGAISRNPKGQ